MTHEPVFRAWWVLAAASAVISAVGFASGCQHRRSEQVGHTETTSVDASLRIPHEIKVKAGDDGESFGLEPKDDGVKVVKYQDGQKLELARLNWKGSRLKIKAPDDHVLGYVERNHDEIDLVDATGKQIVAAWKQTANGGIRVENPSGGALLTCPSREGGFDCKGADGAERFRIRVTEGKTSLKRPDGASIWHTKDPVAAAAFPCLGLTELTMPQRVALFTWIEMERQEP